MNTLLTPEDSERVADAIIEKIKETDIDIQGEVYDAFRSILKPISNRGWHEDWFPLTIQEMCDNIERGVIRAFEQRNKK